MSTKLFAFSFLVFGIISNINAQLKISGEFRTRTIVDHGYMTPVLENKAADYSIDQRTRLNIDYKNDIYTTRIVLQDARIWGSDELVTKTGMWGSTNTFGLHEAWVNLNLSSAFNLKLGRQEWNYDNMRILSSRNWATSAMSYDAALFQTTFADYGLSVDAGFSYNNNSNGTGAVDNRSWQPEKLKSMNFIYAKKQIKQSSYVSLISTLAAKTDTTNNAILGTGTHGIIINYNKGKKSSNGLFGLLEAYYQHGTDMKRGSNAEYKNISAYMLAADLGIRTLNKKLEISVGAELLSGHDQSNTDTDYNNTRHSFDLLYGGRLPYYGGSINYFVMQDSYLVGTKGGGLFDPYFKVRFAPAKNHNIEAAVFFPTLTTNVKAHTGINPATKKPMSLETDANGDQVYWKGLLGTNIDVKYSYKMHKDIVLKSGFSYALVSDIKNQMVNGYNDSATKELYNLGQNYFVWVMLSIKPTFFNGVITNKSNK